jgi:kumamolisin
MAMKANYIALPKSEREPVAGARLMSLANPDERMEVSVRLRRKAKQRPASDRHISYQQLGESYGSDVDDVAKVTDFAARNGLVVVEANAAKRTVKLSGTVRAFSAAFDVQLGHYEHANMTYRGRTGPVGLPKTLEGIVVGVFGLDNRPFARPHFRTFKPRAGADAQFAGLSPLTVAKLYGFPDGDGSGQTVGIIELGGGFRPADLQQYFTSLGVANPKVVTVAVDHGSNQPGSGADLEVGLDIEIIGALVPKATLVVYFAPSGTEASFGDAILDAVHDTVNNPSVISISWGGSEDQATGQFIDDVNSTLSDAQKLGITVLVASGDNGAADMGPNEWDGKVHVDFPSSSPFVVACGATHIDTSGNTLQGESAWNQDFADTDPQVDSFGAVGGGISDVNTPPPSWQENLTLPASVNGGPAGRGVPDVTGNGDPSSGYSVLVDGSSTVVGGTSAVAPLWAALITRINQRLAGRVGFINPRLYTSAGAFNDVTIGNNRPGGAPNPGYDATKGWDACTGLGSPNGNAVLEALTTK